MTRNLIKTGIMTACFSVAIWAASSPEVASAAVLVKPSNYYSLSSGLVGYWTFDGQDTNWATGKLLDKSGRGNDGQIIGMSTSSSPAGGKVGQSLKFDMSNDTVSLGIPTDLDMSQEDQLTISVWVKFADLTVAQGIFARGSMYTAENGYVYVLGNSITNGSRLYFRISDGTADNDLFVSAAAGSVVAGEWMHIVGIVDGTTAYLYKNGKFLLSASRPTFTGIWDGDSDGDRMTSIGSEGDGDNRFFGGNIDDLRVYNRALSPSEVYRLYIMGQATYQPSLKYKLNQGLVGYWSFNNPDVNWATGAVTDLSGNGNTGQINGMATTTAPIQGKVGQAFRFDGVNDYVSPGSGTSLDDIQLQGGGGMSVAFWIKPDEHVASKIIVKGQEANLNGHWLIHRTTQTNPARISFAKEGSTDMSSGWNNTLTAGVWQHIVLTWDGTMLRNGVNGYKNGARLPEADRSGSDGATANSDANNDVRIGAAISDTYFGGNMDDVRIYNRILSDAEIKQLYLMGQVSYQPNKSIP